jgi:flagellar protein FliO/FliZ
LIGMTNAGTSILWFVAIIALIPIALWLLKRTPIGATGGDGVMRHISSLPLAPGQRVVTIEVGSGDERRWLVLGVTAQNIHTLHTMAPQSPPPVAGAPIPPFSQLLGHLRKSKGNPDGQ